ncbi:MAG: hypothetical protein R2991_00080 [Thermoanaerobaculia bacterium]
MGIFHRAVIVPTKEEVLAQWVPTQPWGAPAGLLDVIGSYRLDDPDGRVGMEVFLVAAGDAVLQVPLTYRDEPLEGADAALLTGMQHSVLGHRWVYDGLCDPLFLTVLAAVAMTGQGEALGMAVYDGRWHIAPTNVRIQGGGWTLERVPVDGFELISGGESEVVFANDRFELTVHRRPVPGSRPVLGLSATWPGQPGPVLLAQVTATADGGRSA